MENPSDIIKFKMIVEGFGVVLIGVLVFCKALSLMNHEYLKSHSFKILVNYSTMDRLLRIVQYIGSGLVGDGKNNMYLQLGLAPLVSVQSLLFLSFLMAYGRKVLRVFRAPLCIKSVILNRRIMRVNPFKSTMSDLSAWFLWTGDITDMVFYFTDHFHGLYLLGVVLNHDLCDYLELLGHVMWILNGLLLVCGYALVVVMSRKDKSKVEWGITMKESMLEIVSNFFEFILGFCFIYPHFQTREMISLMAIVSSLVKLYRLHLK